MNARFRTSAVSLGAAIVLAACGGSEPPPEAPTQSSTTSATPPRAPAASPAPAAETPRVAAESCEGVDVCAKLGADLLKSGDAGHARVALDKACSGAVKSADGCALLAGVLGSDSAADPKTVADAARRGCQTTGAETGEQVARGSACKRWGDAQRDGVGADKDADGAARAFDDGCTLGDQDACAAKRDLQAKADDASGVPDANVTIGSATVNGTTVEQIACHSEGGMGLGGLFGSMVIGKPFADKKRALDACVHNGPKKTRVRWQTTGGRMTNVKVISGNDTSNACVERTLNGSQTTSSGLCAATVSIGK